MLLSKANNVICILFVFQVKEWLCLNCQMQRALGASEPLGLPMIKPQISPSKEVPAPTKGKETPISTSSQDIPKSTSSKNELVNVATIKENESPAHGDPTQKVTPAAASLPDKSVTSIITKTDVLPTSQKPPVETPKGQPETVQQEPPKAVTSVAKSVPSPGKESERPPSQQLPKASTSPAKSVQQPTQPAKQESGGFFGFGGPKAQPIATKAAESVTGKMFGIGSSFLSSASTLITSAVQDETKTTPPVPRKMSTTVTPKTTSPASPKKIPVKDTKPPAMHNIEKKLEKPQQEKPPSTEQAKVDKAPQEAPKAPVNIKGMPKADQPMCPLCKMKLNLDSENPPNYNNCTECKTTVCNQCGFNPIPTEAKVYQSP